MYIATASVSSAYLVGCDNGNITENEHFVVRRSKEWDLANPQERFKAALTFLGCLDYLMNLQRKSGKEKEIRKLEKWTVTRNKRMMLVHSCIYFHLFSSG
jgi:hypothetical protein